MADKLLAFELKDLSDRQDLVQSLLDDSKLLGPNSSPNLFK